MTPKEFYDSIPNGRCKPCKYGKVVFAENNCMFIGCYCKPFRGKRVAEIKDCPRKAKITDSDDEKKESAKQWPLKTCINYEDGCEEWAGCPCVYYKAERGKA